MSHQLYYSSFCFFCQKVLMSLKGRQHSIDLVNVNESGRRQELITGGGKSQVPCLRIEQQDGAVQWMYESDDILDYLAANDLVS